MYEDLGSIIPDWYEPQHSTIYELELKASQAECEAFYELYSKHEQGKTASRDELREAHKNWEMGQIYRRAAQNVSCRLTKCPF